MQISTNLDRNVISMLRWMYGFNLKDSKKNMEVSELSLSPVELSPAICRSHTDALATLLWLCVSERIKYKIALLTFRVLHRSHHCTLDRLC